MEWNFSSISAAIFVAVAASFLFAAIVSSPGRTRKISFTGSAVCAVIVVALLIYNLLPKTPSEPPSPSPNSSSITNETPKPTYPEPAQDPSPTSSTPTPSTPIPIPPTSSPVISKSTATASLLLAQQKIAAGHMYGLDEIRTIGTVPYPHSLITPCGHDCLNQPNFIEYGLAQGYSRFEATVGIDANKGSSEQIAIFKVILIGLPGGGEKEAYNKKITFGQEEKISIPLEGATRIRLETLYGGSNPDHARNLSLNPVWGTPTIYQ